MNNVWFTFEIINKWIWDYIVGSKTFRMNNILSVLNVILTKKLHVFFLLKRKQFFKFNSSINLYFIGSPRNERSKYIKYFNCHWSTKLSYSRAALFTFLFICSKEISSLVFVISGGNSFFSMKMSILSLIIHMINLTSSPTLTYSNTFLFTSDFLHFLIYSFNVTFYCYT